MAVPNNQRKTVNLIWDSTPTLKTLLSTGVYNYAIYNKGLFRYPHDYSTLWGSLILLGFSGVAEWGKLHCPLEDWEVRKVINSLTHELSTGPVDA